MRLEVWEDRSMKTTDQVRIETVDKFQRVLEGDAIVAPVLATHIALAAQAYGVENGMGIDEISGIVLGAGAMYHALTGSTA